ncbi:hypothetical protein GCM10010168_28370 [Actinoplanes ianthinogenes]|uniref:DUF2029 domain-containing protein n=1 Tax=Actinoplanes ianthinogenes TaxID=122358 RepID=A0ABM7LL46_9ACTN|nr:hypothetical protein [Actinoplanes ianthinogenes]BCJ39979.1 hypothetical protein Aiant_06360 [Actinoplanes ianthinogenes]GGR09421.1 hypothetical protein GCM10010168_28370 [Actinoplanes ianthinogenes]
MTVSVVDRVVRWNLDIGGDLYGDERERFRWYEGIATASALHSLLIPWAAAVMVWSLGEAAVLPLTIVLVLLFGPMVLCAVYVRRRKVETDPRGWGSKRILITALTVSPYVVFLVGALHADDPAGDGWIGAAVGGVFGAMISILAALRKARQWQQREALAEDED